MGTIIKTTAVSSNGSTSSIDLAVEAGKNCIEKSGLDRTDINLLISIGVYHDDNIMEPAMAPLIQQGLGINPDPARQQEMKFTFCFDLYNGACGFINAVQIADSLIKSKQVDNVLIVSGDAHPSKTRQDDFPFTPLGAAMLLSDGGDLKKGFTDCYLATSANGSNGFTSGGDLKALQARNIDTRKYVDLMQEEGFHQSLCEFTSRSARNYIAQHHINPDSIKFLIASQPENGFARRIGHAFGLNGTANIVEIFDKHGDPHTASLPLGFHELAQSGAMQERDEILFVAAGSGPTSAFARYRA
jgi:3-oxoacyl-[acyl-carrier-protein] synthase-3